VLGQRTESFHRIPDLKNKDKNIAVLQPVVWAKKFNSLLHDNGTFLNDHVSFTKISKNNYFTFSEVICSKNK